MNKTLVALLIFVALVVAVAGGIWSGLTIGSAIVTGVITWKTIVAALWMTGFGVWAIRSTL